ncbi:MAG: hypothetical protein POH28_04480 [Acidocella sp.]|nr:hypothetical protein [Acidocella sp.]
MTNLLQYLQTMFVFTVLCTAFVFGAYWLCQRLRARGHGPKLDAVAGWHDRMSYKGALHSLEALRALHNLPFYGSRQQRETIDMMIVRIQQRSGTER